MLVLARKKGESVKLPGLNVTITVTEVRGSIVRLGFEAPDDVLILRGELDEESGEQAEPTDTVSEEQSHKAAAE